MSQPELSTPEPSTAPQPTPATRYRGPDRRKRPTPRFSRYTLFGGRRRSGGRELEGTFDHGEEGYGLWLDPSIADDPVYAEHWAGQRAVTVKVEADRIVIRRAD